MDLRSLSDSAFELRWAPKIQLSVALFRRNSPYYVCKARLDLKFFAPARYSKPESDRLLVADFKETDKKNKKKLRVVKRPTRGGGVKNPKGRPRARTGQSVLDLITAKTGGRHNSAYDFMEHKFSDVVTVPFTFSE